MSCDSNFILIVYLLWIDVKDPSSHCTGDLHKTARGHLARILQRNIIYTILKASCHDISGDCC